MKMKMKSSLLEKGMVKLTISPKTILWTAVLIGNSKLPPDTFN